jgi:hypothetical protein
LCGPSQADFSLPPFVALRQDFFFSFFVKKMKKKKGGGELGSTPKGEQRKYG